MPHFTTGQRVSFPFDGKDCTGVVDTHQQVSGFVIIRMDKAWVAIRETHVKSMDSPVAQ